MFLWVFVLFCLVKPLHHHNKVNEFQLAFVEDGTETQGSCQIAPQASPVSIPISLVFYQSNPKWGSSKLLPVSCICRPFYGQFWAFCTWLVSIQSIEKKEKNAFFNDFNWSNILFVCKQNKKLKCWVVQLIGELVKT